MSSGCVYSKYVEGQPQVKSYNIDMIELIRNSVQVKSKSISCDVL